MVLQVDTTSLGSVDIRLSSWQKPRPAGDRQTAASGGARAVSWLPGAPPALPVPLMTATHSHSMHCVQIYPCTLHSMHNNTAHCDSSQPTGQPPPAGRTRQRVAQEGDAAVQGALGGVHALDQLMGLKILLQGGSTRAGQQRLAARWAGVDRRRCLPRGGATAAASQPTAVRAAPRQPPGAPLLHLRLPSWHPSSPQLPARLSDGVTVHCTGVTTRAVARRLSQRLIGWCCTDRTLA